MVVMNSKAISLYSSVLVSSSTFWFSFRSFLVRLHPSRMTKRNQPLSFSSISKDVTMDADKQWSVGARPGTIDLETVALHEIGHLLGLGHSSVEGAIMFPGISSEVTKGLHADDIRGIKTLYNARGFWKDR
ncbi:Metalloendoproteinase 1 [Morella rubra]|uniref:Metalloendoproteinase 1 n=1 Tax=Morella rubra TaxID=262757 RepID=A0A6A1V248_9ROSI|nr:Metalloendoproteinase 1 [Morella rubra]KAB1219288.1 Metalloendoproteinase 1 [Morella rubra]